MLDGLGCGGEQVAFVGEPVVDAEFAQDLFVVWLSAGEQDGDVAALEATDRVGQDVRPGRVDGGDS
jgi:hypothetical protein